MISPSCHHTSYRLSVINCRLAEYETLNRLHVRGAGAVALGAAANLLNRIDLVEMTPAVLARALEPFPVPVRTLDGLHLATFDCLPAQGRPVQLATYDRRMRDAAIKLHFELADP
ncbi:MAG: hypothetical protein ACRD1M_08320 [Terriglobales bacterium]